MKKIAALSVLLAIALGVGALDFKVGAEATAQSDAARATSTSQNLFYKLDFGVSYSTPSFDFIWELAVDTEQKYPASFMGDLFGPLSVGMGEAGLRYHNSWISLSAGRFINSDIVDSPYSLFISGAGNKATLGEMRIERGNFFYLDRWVGLNHNLSTDLYSSSSVDGTTCNIYRDRGMVFKTYGVKLGDFRIGFQDALLFTGEYFDVDAFLNPAPGFFVQYVNSASGRPWSASGDMNSILGFFADYRSSNAYLYAQILVDDFNANRFFNPSSYQNPDKIALSLGGTLNTSAGKVGAFLAGATRYTFESVRNEFYSYTYYPGSAVLSDGTLVGIPVSDLMIGYVNGENNFSSMLTWEGNFLKTKLSADLEFRLTGSQSPANPWQDGESWTNGTHWLDDSVLEKRLTLGFKASRGFGAFTICLSGVIGYVWNRLELSTPTNNDSSYVSDGVTLHDTSSEPRWIPSEDSGFIGAVSLGVNYRFSL